MYRRFVSAAAASAALALAPHDARGTTRTFTGGATGLGTSWATASNWNPNGIPQTGDDVVIPGITSSDTLVYYDYFGILSINTLTLNHNNTSPAGTATSIFSQGAFGLSATAEYIGDTPAAGGSRGRGRYDQSGGANTATLMVLGRDATTVGSYNLSGTGVLNTTTLLVGGASTGLFSQIQATHNGNNVTLGDQAGSSGSYTQVAGKFDALVNFTIGNYGSGTFNLSGGGTARQTSESGFSVIGNQAGSIGTATVSGAGSTWSNDRLFVGSVGTGTLTIQDGGAVTNANTYLGFAGAGNGTVTVTGAGSTFTTTSGLRVGGTSGAGGSGGTGTLNIQDGGQVSSFSGFIGGSPGSNGTVTVTGAGSTWSIGESMGIGPFGSGTLNIDPGGTVTVVASLVDSGVVRLRGGRLDAGTIYADSGTFDWTSGTLHAGSFVGNLVNQAGTLAPGHSPGQTVVTGDFTQQSGGTLQIEIGGTGSGQFDFLGVSGVASLGGALQISLLNGFVPQPRDAFRFTTYGSRIGTFAAISGYAIAPGQDFAVVYRSTEAALIAGEWHGAQIFGVLDVPGTKLDVTGAIHWDGTLVKQGAGSMIVDLSGGGSSNVAAGSLLYVQAGDVILKSNVGATSPNLAVQLNGGDATSESTQRFASLDVANGRTATMLANGNRVLEVDGLELHDTGVLALNDNDLIVDYTGTSVETQVRQWVKDGLADGSGITTLATPAGDTVLAVADAVEWGHTTFNGITIDDTTVVGKYTYYGDANLDGKVTSDDYVAVDVGLGVGDSWVQGDFNFSGTVTSDDYVAIDVNLGKGTPTSLAFAELKAEMIALHTAMFGDEYVQKLALAEAEGFAALVPEPGAASAMLLVCALIDGPRRARRRRGTI